MADPVNISRQSQRDLAKAIGQAFEQAFKRHREKMGGGDRGSGDSYTKKRQRKEETGETGRVGETEAILAEGEARAKTFEDQLAVLQDLQKLGTAAGPAAIEAYNDVMDGLSDDFKAMASQYDAIQEVYGGLSDLQEATGAAKAAKERLELFQDLYYGTQVSVEGYTKSLQAMAMEQEGIDLNEMARYFDDEAEAANAAEDVLQLLVSQHSSYVNEMDALTKAKLPLYEKAMGISSQRVAEIVEKNIAFTGKATTTQLDEVAAYSKALAETTGAPLKEINAISLEIIANTKAFGDMSSEQATRIAANLTQLGMKYGDFETLTTKFQEYGGAAQAAGQLAQLTGGQLQFDVQELMTIASENQEDLIPFIKEQFEAQGFDAEQFKAMTKAEQRALQQVLGLDTTTMLTLLGQEAVSDEEIQATQKRAKEAGELEKGARVVMDQMRQTEKAFTDMDEVLKNQRKKQMLMLREQSFELAKETSKFQANLLTNVKPVNLIELTKIDSAFDSFTDEFKNLNQRIDESEPLDMNKLFKGGTELTTASTKIGEELGNAINKGVSNGVGVELADINNSLQKVNEDNNLPAAVKSSIDEFNETVAKLEKAKDSGKERETKKLIDKLGEVITAINATVDVETKQPVILNMDGVKVGEIIIDSADKIEGAGGGKLNIINK